VRAFRATVTSKGQVTIPVEIRRRLGIGPGSKVAFTYDNQGKVEFKRAEYTLEEVMGVVPALKGRETVDFDDLIAEAMEDMADEEVRTLLGGRQ
jgi:AbrB family looped-hinge helix DNA binding protein